MSKDVPTNRLLRISNETHSSTRISCHLICDVDGYIVLLAENYYESNVLEKVSEFTSVSAVDWASMQAFAVYQPILHGRWSPLETMLYGFNRFSVKRTRIHWDRTFCQSGPILMHGWTLPIIESIIKSLKASGSWMKRAATWSISSSWFSWLWALA